MSVVNKVCKLFKISKKEKVKFNIGLTFISKFRCFLWKVEYIILFYPF